MVDLPFPSTFLQLFNVQNPFFHPPQSHNRFFDPFDNIFRVGFNNKNMRMSPFGSKKNKKGFPDGLIFAKLASPTPMDFKKVILTIPFSSLITLPIPASLQQP